MSKWLEEGPKWLDEPGDEFDQSIKAGTNTLGQIVGDSAFGEAARNLKSAAKKALDLDVQAGDMLVGFSADAVGKARNAAARFGMSGSRMSQKEIGQEAESAEDLGPFEWAKTPFASLRKVVTGKDSKEVVPVSQWIDSFAQGVEKRTNGKLTAEDVKFSLGAAFDVAGMAGLHAGALKIGERAAAQADFETKTKAAADQRAAAEEAKLDAESAALQGRAKAAPAINAAAREAKQQTFAERVEAQKAAEQSQGKWLEENPEFAPNGEEPAAPTPIEPSATSIQASPTIIGQPRPSLETALEKAKAGKNFDMTAEERVALRGLAENPQILDAEGKPPGVKASFGQAGGVDPKLLAGIAAVGGGAVAGAYLGEDLHSTVLGALAGALAGTRAGRGILVSPRMGLEKTLGLTSTRLGAISPALLRGARDMEQGVMKRTDQALDAAHPFVEQVSNMKPEEQAAVDNALLNGGELPDHIVPAYTQVHRLLDGLGRELKSLGRFKEGVSDYFPRMVKDIDGLKEAIGSDNAKGLDKALMDAQAKSAAPLTDVEQSVIINRWLAAPDRADFLPGYAKARRVGEITPELQKFYEKPTDSLVRYISGAISDIEKAKFFGKDLKNKMEGGKTFVDTEESIGALAQRLQSEGKLNSPAQVNELKSLLRSRFVGGEKSMAGPLQDVRNLSNLGLLGNAWSAATQVGDSLMTVYHQGMKPTYQALVQKVLGKEQLSPKELGIVNHVMEELSTQRMSGKALQAGLKYSAFQAIDQFAKGLGTNAALIKARNMVTTPKGLEHFREKWGEAYGDAFGQLAADLKEGKITDLTESYAFNELSNMQPISKLEMPQAYLDNPNGRLLYQMKTYMLKQADVVRRDVAQEIKKGNIARGVKNAALLAETYALANMPGDAIKAFLSGQNFDITGLGMVENILQTFGVNRYAADELRQGKVKQVLQDTVTPPAIQMAVDTVGGTDQALRYIPIIGRGVYDYLGGGNERKEISDRKRLPKDERPPLSPDAESFLKKKRDERAAKKISDVGDSPFAKKMAAMSAREEYRNQQRDEVAKEAFKRFGRKGLRDFLAEEEQAEIRRAQPRKRLREVM